MAKPNYMRQADWYDPEKHQGAVTIIGCGGIGSVAALALAKLGIPKLTLIDPDHVEPHNLPNQMFTTGQVGMSKVDAMEEQIRLIREDTIDLDTYENTAEEAKDELGLNYGGVIVSGLDSMEARTSVWHNIIKGNGRVPIYFDARLGGEQIVLYATRPGLRKEADLYSESLHSDEEAKEDPCTRRSIIDVGFTTAALITRGVRKHLIGEEVEPILVHNQETFLCVKAEREAVAA